MAYVAEVFSFTFMKEKQYYPFFYVTYFTGVNVMSVTAGHLNMEHVDSGIIVFVKIMDYSSVFYV